MEIKPYQLYWKPSNHG